MSTIYATFDQLDQARSAINELLQDGVANDSLSLVARTADDTDSDDLSLDSSPSNQTVNKGMFDLDSATPIPGLDTSSIAHDIDSVDQSDDSQSDAEDLTYPTGGLSEEERESQELSLAYSTEPDPVEPSRFEENTDASLETLRAPGFGLIVGGGALATTSLEFVRVRNSTEVVRRHLMDEGVPVARVHALTAAMEHGRPVVAVDVLPGEAREEHIEEVLARHGSTDYELFDAPRFYNNGGRYARSGGGES